MSQPGKRPTAIVKPTDTAIATHAGGKPTLTMTDISAAVVAGTMSKDDALALSREITKAGNGAGDLKKIPFPVV